MKKLTTEEFILKAKLVYGEKYDYSLTEYINSKLKIKIICPEHGIFEQIPNSHLNGYECYHCGNNIRILKNAMNNISFINKVKEIHGYYIDTNSF